MSVVDNLVTHFENLSSEMDTRKGKLTRKGSTKSVPEKNSSRVKRFITDLTDIKRPTTKYKSAVEGNAAEKSKTLPKNFNTVRNEFNIKSDNTCQISSTGTSNKKKEDKTSRNIKEKVNKTTSDPGPSCLNDKFEEIVEQSIEIEKKVEQFGENLKQKRQYSLHHHHHHHRDEFSNFHNPAKYETEEIVEESNESDIFDEEDGGESSDDMFGFNNFDENEKDNYIVETYNKLGQELVITTLEITHHTITKNDVDGDSIKNLIDNSDYVIHNNEYVSSNSSSEDDRYEATVREESENIDDFSEHPTFLYNNYFHHNAHSSSEDTLYDEVTTDEPYQPPGYISNEESQDPFYQNVNNFSNCEEAINVQEDNKSNKISTLNINLEKKQKIQYVIEEMIKTEGLYIAGLNIVVMDYMPFVYKHTPQDLIGRTAYLFGNIEEIYKNAKEFLQLLKHNDGDANSVAQIFIDSVSKFEHYPLYSKNKPTADLYLKQFDGIIKERQSQLRDKLGLASYLLTPIQRLGKYVLLLEQIQKEFKKLDKPVEKITSAISVVRGVMRKGNDYIAIDSIKDSEIDLTNKGSFIMRALFNVILKPRKYVSMVFLFDNIVVFTEKTAKNVEQFKYQDSIQMSDLSLGKFEEKPNIFHLTNYAKSKKAHPDATFILEAESPKVKNEWTQKIEEKLWSQLLKAKDQQEKLCHTTPRHAPKTPMPSGTTIRTRKSKLDRKSKSKFYDHQNS